VAVHRLVIWSQDPPIEILFKHRRKGLFEFCPSLTLGLDAHTHKRLRLRHLDDERGYRFRFKKTYQRLHTLTYMCPFPHMANLKPASDHLVCKVCRLWENLDAPVLHLIGHVAISATARSGYPRLSCAQLAFDLPTALHNVVIGSQSKEEPLRHAKVARKAQVGVSGHRSLARCDFVDPTRRNVDGTRQGVLAEIHWLHERFEQDFNGMRISQKLSHVVDNLDSPRS